MDENVKEELKEILEKLKELKSKTLNTNDLKEALSNAYDGKVSIKFEYDSGQSEASIEGNRITMLIALAILENIILEKTKAPTKLYEVIKKAVNESGFHE